MDISNKQFKELLDQYGWEVSENEDGEFFVTIVDIDGESTDIYIEPNLESISKFLDINIENIEIPEE